MSTFILQSITDFCLSEWNRKLARGERRISDRECVLSLNTNHLNPRLRGAKKKERKGTGPNQTDCAEIYSSSGIRMGKERGNVFVLTHLQDFVKLPTTNSLP